MKKTRECFNLLTIFSWISLLIFLTFKKAEIWPITIGLLLSPIYGFILRKNNIGVEGQELIGVSLFLGLSTTTIVWSIVWLFTKTL